MTTLKNITFPHTLRASSIGMEPALMEILLFHTLRAGSSYQEPLLENNSLHYGIEGWFQLPGASSGEHFLTS